MLTGIKFQKKTKVSIFAYFMNPIVVFIVKPLKGFSTALMVYVFTCRAKACNTFS